jgi:PhnB protein
MPTKKPTIHTDYAAVMPYLCVKGAAKAIAFYKKAFGAKERFSLTMGGQLAHAEIAINGCVIMLCDEFPEMGFLGPKSLKGTPVTMAVMVANCDAAVKKAVAAGATVKRPASDEFYGDRSAQIEDPFGHIWMLQQRLEDVPPKEMQRRLDMMMVQMTTEPAKTPPKKKRKG